MTANNSLFVIIGIAVLVVLGAATVLFLHPLKFPPPRNDSVIAGYTRTIAAPDTLPDDRARAYYQRAAAYRRQGEPANAIADYRAILRFESDREDIAPAVQLQIIATYRDAGDFAHALAEWKVYAARPKHDYSALLSRAAIYRAMHDDSHERADLDAAIANAPMISQAYLERARYFDRLGQYDAALRDLDVAQKLQANEYQVRTARAGVYMHKWDFAAAWREFALLAGKAQTDNRTSTLERRAQNESDNLQYARAIADYTALIARNRKQAWYYDSRAELYLWSGQTDKALADYKQAIFEEPTQPSPHMALGKAYSSLFRFDEALAEFKLGVVYSDSAADRRIRGYTEQEMGRDDDAAADFNAALAIDPKDIYAAMGLHLVRLRAHKDDKAELARHAAAIPSPNWPRPVLDYQLGRLTRDQLLVAIRKVDGQDTVGERLCVVNYFTGIMALDRGDRAAGIAALRAAAQSCPPGFLEHGMAAWALKRAGS